MKNDFCIPNTTSLSYLHLKSERGLLGNFPVSCLAKMPLMASTKKTTFRGLSKSSKANTNIDATSTKDVKNTLSEPILAIGMANIYCLQKGKEMMHNIVFLQTSYYE